MTINIRCKATSSAWALEVITYPRKDVIAVNDPWQGLWISFGGGRLWAFENISAHTGPREGNTGVKLVVKGMMTSHSGTHAELFAECPEKPTSGISFASFFYSLFPFPF